MTSLLSEFPLTFWFDDNLAIGKVLIDNAGPEIQNIHEYFLAPRYFRNEAGSWEVLSYSLVHRSALPPAGEMEKREAQS